MTNKIGLNELPRALRAHGIDTTYHQAWSAVVRGIVPAERVGARWLINANDLSLIAATLPASERR